MNKFIRNLTVGIALLLQLSLPIFAFATVIEPIVSEDMTLLEPVIATEDAMEVGRSTIFDASQSFVPSESEGVNYVWDFGDGNTDQGLESLHTYDEFGEYKVRLTVQSGEEVATVEKNIFAYTSLKIFCHAFYASCGCCASLFF